MKNFFISIFIAVTSFFGIGSSRTVQIQTQPTEDISPTIESSPSASLIATISSTPKKISISISPTKVPVPTTSITVEVLKKFFNMSDEASIQRILNDPGALKEYDRYFYAKFQKFPIPRITITGSKQLIVMPRDNGLVVCTGEQLGTVYYEIEKFEKDLAFKQMDTQCHYGSNAETKECQGWRRDNDQDRSSRSGGNSIEGLSINRNIETNRYNELSGKYCIGN